MPRQRGSLVGLNSSRGLNCSKTGKHIAVKFRLPSTQVDCHQLEGLSITTVMTARHCQCAATGFKRRGMPGVSRRGKRRRREISSTFESKTALLLLSDSEAFTDPAKPGSVNRRRFAAAKQRGPSGVKDRKFCRFERSLLQSHAAEQFGEIIQVEPNPESGILPRRVILTLRQIFTLTI